MKPQAATPGHKTARVFAPPDGQKSVRFLQHLDKIISTPSRFVMEIFKILIRKNHRIQAETGWSVWETLGLLRLRLFAAGLAGSVALAHAAGASPPTPLGDWITANHSAVVRIAPCGSDLCGQIVGIVLDHPTDPMPTGWLGQPQCGMIILQVAPVTDPDSGSTAWSGSVLDARDGHVYHARIWLDASQNLHLRGWLGLPIFGQSQTWTRFTNDIPTDCKLVPGAS